MNGAAAVAEILRREGVEYVFCFPQNPVIDRAAAVGIRPIVAREERTAINMADVYARITSGHKIGICMVQEGPGAEHAFGSIAQAHADSTPVLIITGGVPRARLGLRTSFDSVRAFEPITKWAARLETAASIPDQMRRAFAKLRFGRLGPVLLEMPADVALEELPGDTLDYVPPLPSRSAADPADVTEAIRLVLSAKRPVIYVGAGVLYAEASAELIEFAELLGAPVMTTYTGKSAFPEDHPLALGAGGCSVSPGVTHFLPRADTVLAIGSSLHRTLGACAILPSTTIVQCTSDPDDLAMQYSIAAGVLGDAKLVIGQFIEEIQRQEPGRHAPSAAREEIATVRAKAMRDLSPLMNSADKPINPYRLISDIMKTVDPARTIITHDSGSPRDQLAPIYESVVPHGYLGWGNTTPLGASIGLALGAKAASPDKVVMNLMGDGAFGQVGIDIETSVRERLPIICVLMNNHELGNYEKHQPIATEKFGLKYLTGHFAEVGDALGAYSRRVEDPDEIIPALKDALAEVESGKTVLLEFMTRPEQNFPHLGI